MEKHTTPEKQMPRYRHRDIDWLRFNERVLQEAADPDVPIYERLRFLAIFSSNLDEFFRVRVSKLRQLKRVDKHLRKRLSMRPNKTLKAILTEVHRQQELFGEIYRGEILPALESHGIYLVNHRELAPGDRHWAGQFFWEQIAGDFHMKLSPSGGKPFLGDGDSYLALFDPVAGRWLYFPATTAFPERFVRLPGSGTYRFQILEDLLKIVLSGLSGPNADPDTIYSIKISRDAELYLDEEGVEQSLVAEIQQSLKKRSRGQPTRLLYDARMPDEQVRSLRKDLGLGKLDLVPGGQYHNFSDFMNFPNPVGDSLEYKPMPPLPHPGFPAGGNLFDVLDRKDLLIHFPYQDFGHIIGWVEQAAKDPRVRRIDISLYRIASDSRLARALIAAIRRGVEVSIFVEAKARFDEENNLEWGKAFEDHGAHVIYSFPKLKVHSKVLLISRETNGALSRYAYFGTGNFNEKTARIYADHALLTSREDLTADLEAVFDFLKDTRQEPVIGKLLVSPFNTREKFTGLVRQEIRNAADGLPAGITAKMNSLEDRGMIDLLYEASAAGVPVRLLVRGFCCLLPGLPGLSERIFVTSVVDRFLEHGRIYRFENGGDPRLYMGSADWMTRNLDRRVEVLVPIHDTGVFKELNLVLEIQLADNVKARIQDADGTNTYRGPQAGEVPVRSQYAIYEMLQAL